MLVFCEGSKGLLETGWERGISPTTDSGGNPSLVLVLLLSGCSQAVITVCTWSEVLCAQMEERHKANVIFEIILCD